MSKPLQTAEVKGVEILAVGKWNGDDYTDQHLTDMVSAFDELKGKIDPPGKLGHDKAQQLAQKDGFPAIGWVERLYREGKKLLADFAKVPRKVAELIEAGAYDKVSSEVYFDREIDGKTYPRILSAVAFLGADAPAVKNIQSISDVADLYRDRLPVAEAHYVEIERAHTYDWGDDLPPTTVGAALEATIHQTFTDKADSFRKFSVLTTEERISLSNAIDDALKTFLAGVSDEILNRPITGQVAGSYYTDKAKEADMDIKLLAEKLGLPADADEATVNAKLDELKAVEEKAKADPKPEEKPDGALTEIESRQLRDRVGTLERQLAEQEAEGAVSGALTAGKITPGQKDWAHDYALKDPEGFKAYAEAAPKIAVLSGPLGSESGTGAADTELTDAERAVAASLGVSEASLERAKSGKSIAALKEEQLKEREKARATA